jgi:fatty-acyl-CoA synthase
LPQGCAAHPEGDYANRQASDARLSRRHRRPGREIQRPPALLSDRERFSYRDLGERSNRYARWALAQGLGKGETICLLMPNRPEFMALWLGVTRIGGVVALVSTHLTGPALAYCINVVHPRHIVVADALLAQFDTARAHITSDAKLWLHGDADANLPRIDREVDALPGDRLADADRRQLTIEDRALYIYNTTGLPKAANVNHYRLMLASHAFSGVIDARASDRMYDCLPMYHSAGGVVATGAVLINGGSVVLRERFSAHEFWDDLVRWDCTLFQYIGEMCRYLLNSPPHPKEREHNLRLTCGNGLRPEIWAQFQRRFRIPQIIECYGATEGNVAMFNFDGKEGAVGRIPWFVAHRFPTKVVRFDVETQQPARNEQGFCIECAVDETGEVIGKILKDSSKPGARFEGYATQNETDRKILRDVFETGDVWFRTGDLMRKDAAGYFFFVDRIGDTFRSGYRMEQLKRSEIPEVIRCFRDWFPDITVGAESCYQREDFYSREVSLEGEPERDVIVLLVKKDQELVAIASLQRSEDTLTLYGRLVGSCSGRSAAQKSAGSGAIPTGKGKRQPKSAG